MSHPTIPQNPPNIGSEGIQIGRRSFNKQPIITQSPMRPSGLAQQAIPTTPETEYSPTPTKSSNLGHTHSPSSSFNRSDRVNSFSYSSSYKKSGNQPDSPSKMTPEGSYNGSRESSHLSNTSKLAGIYPPISSNEIGDILGNLESNSLYYDPAEDPDIEQMNYTKNTCSPQHLAWAQSITQDIPVLTQAREVVYPLHRAASLVKELNPGTMKAKEKVKKEVVIQMILQHLHVKGYNVAREILENESGIKTPTHNLNRSILLHTLYNSIHNSDLVYDIVVEDKRFGSDVINEHFQSIGLGVFSQDVDDSVKLYDDPEVQKLKGTKFGNVTVDDNSDKNMNLNTVVFKLTAFGSTVGVFVKAICMFLTTFTKPEKFFLKLMERLNIPDDFEPENGGDKTTYPNTISSKVAAVLKNWIDSYVQYYDLETKRGLVRLMEEHIKVSEGIVLGSLKRSVDILTRQIEEDRKIAGFNPVIKQSCIMAPLKKIEDTSSSESQLPSSSKLTVELFKNLIPSVRFIDIDDDVLVSQFTYMEAAIFYQIKPTEFFGQAWAKAKYRHRAQNILESTQMFNFISSFFVNLLLNTPELEDRVTLAKKVIRLGIKAHDIKNYDLLCSLTGAVGDAAIFRMKRTWAALENDPEKDEFEKLKTLFTKNYAGFRAEVKGIFKTACLPFIGTYLTDYTFLDDGNPDLVGDKINVDKRLRLYDCIDNVVRFKDTKYDIVPIPQIICYIKNYFFEDGIITDEKSKYEKSLKTEPRQK
ncbi:Ras guanine nucleotide exchange factor [Entamoeba marina]